MFSPSSPDDPQLVTGTRTDPREVLTREFPRLRIKSIELLGEGWDHVAYLVNHEVVFRMPWQLIDPTETTDPVPTAEPEIGLLRVLGGRLPVTVPEPMFVARDGTYFGYPYLPGRSVADTLDMWSNDAALEALVEVLVDVAVGIEAAVSVEEAQRIGLKQLVSVPHNLAQTDAAMKHALVPGRVRAVAEAAMATYSHRWETAAARRMVTLHADFGLDHWLIDGQGEVYALLDWSDACVAPPEHQLATLMWDIPALVDAVAARYTARTGDHLDPQLIFADGYVNALADLGELLDEGLSKDDADVERCIHFLDGWGELSGLSGSEGASAPARTDHW